MSSSLVRVATLALPAGSVRERYRQEFLADLHVFRGRARLAFALGILVDAFALRAAVGGEVAPVAERDFAVARKPLLCRLRFHRLAACHNEDGDFYLRCRRCGADHFELVPAKDNGIVGNLFGQFPA